MPEGRKVGCPDRWEEGHPPDHHKAVPGPHFLGNLDPPTGHCPPKGTAGLCWKGGAYPSVSPLLVLLFGGVVSSNRSRASKLPGDGRIEERDVCDGGFAPLDSVRLEGNSGPHSDRKRRLRNRSRSLLRFAAHQSRWRGGERDLEVQRNPWRTHASWSHSAEWEWEHPGHWPVCRVRRTDPCAWEGGGELQTLGNCGKGPWV